MYCEKCGTENVDEATFCKNCGEMLKRENHEDVDLNKNKLIYSQEEQIRKNKEIIESQEAEIAKNNQIINNKNNFSITNDQKNINSSIQDLILPLFYWEIKPKEYRLSKTKIFSIIIFMFFFFFYYATGGKSGGGIFVALIFSIPAFLIGFIIHKLTKKDI